MQIFDSDFTPDFIVGLWRGGSPVGIAVQDCLEYLGVSTDHISVRTSYRGMDSYENMIQSVDNIRVHDTQYLIDNLNADNALLIVDDVYSSGLSVQAVINRLQKKLRRNMPKQVKVAVPWYKPERNQTQREPDFYLHKTSDWLVLPYELNGLSDDEIAQHKPMVAQVIAESGLQIKGS